MTTCKTCLYWDTPKPFEDFYGEKYIDELGLCFSEKLGTTNHVMRFGGKSKGKPDDISILGDKAKLYTGPEFSCSHYKAA